MQEELNERSYPRNCLEVEGVDEKAGAGEELEEEEVITEEEV